MKKPLLLGYDIGSSSIKASLINADTGELVAAASSPDTEMKIDSPVNGWAEQHPETWWQHVVISTKKMLKNLTANSFEVLGIGISYQMHGLVLVNKQLEVIYPSIIWCDSRAVQIGNSAFRDLGQEHCLKNYLNSPGNFTASKLKWVKENKPDVYESIYKIMLPGDYIALKLTNEAATTISGLSEGIFWDFNSKKIAYTLIEHYNLNKNYLADIVPTFGIQGKLTAKAASELGLTQGIPIAYRAGDQPNNAFSLNVLERGEVAATAGTSGVIYGVSDKNIFDTENRVNTFAHVNYSKDKPNVGVLLCINGTGIQYSWLKNIVFNNRYSYKELNEMGEQVEIGCRGLMCFPFGNGAERVLKNAELQAALMGINFNIHDQRHLIRAVQEGIVFAFRYGLDVMKSIGMEFSIVKVGNTNLFQSKLFKDAFVNTCNINLEIFNTDGSQGAARGAGIGVGIFSENTAFRSLKMIERLSPEKDLANKYDDIFNIWKKKLINELENK
ncbi:MAG: carbohydrate kinase [Ignavibacteriaceae bacterium]|nr:carbohydrate kinase [Ignavibacteriaceae bacterium]